MLNRSQPPLIKDIQSLRLPMAELHRLDNGIPVYVTDLGTQEVVRLEIVFNAGRPFERKPLAARATASQLREGSRHYSAAEVAEALDFYGCSLSIPPQLDTANLILYSLNKHFRQALAVVKDLLAAPAFPEQELAAFSKRNQRRLEVDLAKDDVLAYRLITELIFGEQHPYGYNSSPAAYDALRQEDLIEHWGRLYNSANCSIFLSGRITPALLAEVNEALSSAIPAGQPQLAVVPPLSSQPEHRFVKREASLQSAIKIGRSLFPQRHEDFPGMFVLNTLLGGYFGSRLMANIREDKGYTYNIYSSLESMHFGGGFYIGTEVSRDQVEPTLKEIYLEMERLQQDPVDEEELSMVRNYLMGSFLSMLDGPFNVSEIIRTQVLEELPSHYFDNLVETVKHISAAELQALAQKYLNKNEMWQVVVGS